MKKLLFLTLLFFGTAQVSFGQADGSSVSKFDRFFKAFKTLNDGYLTDKTQQNCINLRGTMNRAKVGLTRIASTDAEKDLIKVEIQKIKKDPNFFCKEDSVYPKCTCKAVKSDFKAFLKENKWE